MTRCCVGACRRVVWHGNMVWHGRARWPSGVACGMRPGLRVAEWHARAERAARGLLGMCWEASAVRSAVVADLGGAGCVERVGR